MYKYEYVQVMYKYVQVLLTTLLTPLVWIFSTPTIDSPTLQIPTRCLMIQSNSDPNYLELVIDLTS